MKPVTLSLRAQADLQDIAVYIGAYSLRAGERIARELFSACQRLGDYPERYAIAEQINRPGVRRAPQGDYLIFYAVRDEDVIVLRILHGARDYAGLFD